MTGYNWEKITEDFNANSGILDSIKNNTDEFIESYRDHAEWKAGWHHDFVCDYCSGALVFDPNERGVYTCSVCKKENTGDHKDWAWTASYRGTSCAYVKYSGMFYNITKQEKYLVYIRKVMNFLTDNYHKFEAYAPNLRFLGRYTGIGLSDAANTMSLLYGIDAAQDYLTAEELNKWHKGFFTPQAEMFDFFSNKIYNIPLWQKVSEANIGVFFKDKTIIDRAFYSRFGILDQLRRGVTKDGMWFEASTGYHFFGLAATAELLLLCNRNGLFIPEHDELMDIIESQFLFPLKIMFRDGAIANPCDSGLDMDVFKYRNAYVKACALFDNPHFKQVLGYIKRKKDLPITFDEILYGIEYEESDDLPDFSSNNFEDSFCAMIKNDFVEVYLKTGIKTICHSHPDVMTMELAFFGDLVSKDIGSAGYSSQIFSEWQHKTIAHNTVTVNQQDQIYTPVGEGIWPEGIIEYYDKHRIKAKSKNVYECVDYTRELRLENNKVYDRFSVKAVDDLELDYAFYCKGNCIIDAPYEDVDKIGDSEGYQHLFDIKKIDNSKSTSIIFDMEDKTLTVKVEPEDGSLVYVVNSYVNNFNDTRYGIIIRRNGIEKTFKVKYECVMKEYKMQVYETHILKESHCDCFRRLKLKHMFIMMQDVAYKDLNTYGYGRCALLEKDLAFLIRRSVVNVINAPYADDKVIVGTSQVAQEGITYTRDFVFQCNNKTCITATTQWFLCRVSDKTVARPTVDSPSYGQDAVGLTINSKPIISIKDAKEYDVVKVGYSLIDGNMHVNNSEYVSWACDAPCASDFLEKGSYNFDVYFRKEVIMGSVVSLRQEVDSVCGVTEMKLIL